MQPTQPGLIEVSMDDLLLLIGRLYVENQVLQQRLALATVPQNGQARDVLPGAVSLDLAG